MTGWKDGTVIVTVMFLDAVRGTRTLGKKTKKKRERKYIQILLSLCPPPRARVTSRIVRERSLLPGPCRDRPRVMSEPEEKKKI